MGLNFPGGTATDRVVITADASIDDLTAFTALAWFSTVAPDATFRRLWTKNSTGVNDGKKLVMDTNNLFLDVTRAGAMAHAAVSTSAITNGAWLFLACTYDESDGPRLFLGDLSTTVAEVSYSQGPDIGSGATDPEDDLWVGNRQDNQARCWDGDIGRFQYISKRMVLSEIRQQQFIPFNTPEMECWLELGWPEGVGSDQTDYSGTQNPGTVTGAPLTAHMPLPSPFVPTQSFFVPPGIQVGLPFGVTGNPDAWEDELANTSDAELINSVDEGEPFAATDYVTSP